MTTYNYHIEDGQFSYDFTEIFLLGEEGGIAKHNTGRNEEDEFYIIYISGNYIECIGNVERNFPINVDEHNRLKTLMQGL